MKKLIFYCSILFTMLACSSVRINDKTKIEGIWRLEKIDGINVNENDKFVLEFTESTQTFYSRRETSDSAYWNTTRTPNSLNNGILTFVYSNGVITIEIIECTPKKLLFYVISQEEDGKQIVNESIYEAKKAETNYSDKILGLWEGRSTNIEYEDELHRWEYFTDGTFKYYFLENDKWIEKKDNNGRYRLYGDLLVTEFNNHYVIEDIDKQACELWTLKFSGSKMSIGAMVDMDDDLEFVSFNMKKIK